MKGEEGNAECDGEGRKELERKNERVALPKIAPIFKAGEEDNKERKLEGMKNSRKRRMGKIRKR